MIYSYKYNLYNMIYNYILYIHITSYIYYITSNFGGEVLETLKEPNVSKEENHVSKEL